MPETAHAARRASLTSSLEALGFRRAFQPPPLSLESLGKRGYLVTGTAASMTTHVTVAAVGRSGPLLEDAVGRAFEAMDRVVRLLNRHAGDSAVTALNDAGRLDAPPPELTEVLAAAYRVWEVSGGRFDVTVKPLLDHAAALTGPVPAAVRELVGLDGLQVEAGRLAFSRSGMGVTLDGIAKGYVVDRMADVLRHAGLCDWLVDAGGDIRVSGRGPGGRPWRIGVRDPNRPDHHTATISLEEGAIATSGGYERRLDAAGLRHHILDVETATSPQALAGVTVTAPDTMTADALATTLFTLPPPGALRLADALPGCSCLLLTPDGHALASRRWRGRTDSEPIAHRSP